MAERMFIVCHCLLLSAPGPKWRRLTVTLAWLSPISPSRQKYRIAGLWFEVNNSGLAPTRTDADWRAVRRGTVQHEVFEGQRAEPFIDGTVIEIKVNCREDAGKIENPIAYGLAVSLEVSEGVDIAIYDEIRTRTRLQFRFSKQQIGARASCKNGIALAIH